jgi:hypothetical protein
MKKNKIIAVATLTLLTASSVFAGSYQHQNVGYDYNTNYNNSYNNNYNTGYNGGYNYNGGVTIPPNNNYNYNVGYNYVQNTTPIYVAATVHVTTGGTSNVYTNTANVAGNVNVSGGSNGYNNNVSGTAYFQYGTSQHNLNLSTSPASIYGATNLNGNLNNLTCGNTYYYRAVANVNGNMQYGQTLSFTTQTCQNYVNYNTNYQPQYIQPQYIQPQVVHVPQYVEKPVYITKYVNKPVYVKVAPKKRVGYKTVNVKKVVKYYY